VPKQLLVDPVVVLQPGELKFASVPLHAYSTPFADELAAHGPAVLKDVLRHMLVIREFESMLGSFKATGAYRGISFAYKGPAHLSIGQEGVAVGAALGLRPRDLIFGSHRSHGEFIAKGLAAIRTLDEPALDAIMAGHEDGALRDGVARHIGGEGRDLAENFLLFGLLAQIFMRSTGGEGAKPDRLSPRRSEPIRTTPSSVLRPASPRARRCGRSSGPGTASASPMPGMARPAAARCGRR